MGGTSVTVRDRTVTNWDGLTDTMFIDPMAFGKYSQTAGLTEKHGDRSCFGQFRS